LPCRGSPVEEGSSFINHGELLKKWQVFCWATALPIPVEIFKVEPVLEAGVSQLSFTMWDWEGYRVVDVGRGTETMVRFSSAKVMHFLGLCLYEANTLFVPIVRLGVVQ